MTPLELFFDLVFVLAITQCTALMSHHPTWSGLAQGLLVLGMLWWAWTGYAWLTSVLDPEEGAVRLVMFGAMAALLLVSLCVPEAFGGLALAFALIYGVVRSAHIALFMLASPEDDGLRHSVLGLAVSTAGRGRRCWRSPRSSTASPRGRSGRWRSSSTWRGPYFFGSEGWKLMPGHFAERHGLIVIIALGESIVAIGVGASHTLNLGIGTAAVLGVALTAAMWWTYFDIVAIVAGRRLVEAEPGRVQNEMARDSYSYMHLVMVAGIVLVALGLKTTIGHFGDHLHAVPAFALLGGLAIYLLGHVAFRYRHVHTINRQRLLLAIVLLHPRAGRDRGPGAGRARRRQRADLGDDRLRDPQLRRGAPPGPPPRSRLSLTVGGVGRRGARTPASRRRSRSRGRRLSVPQLAMPTASASPVDGRTKEATAETMKRIEPTWLTATIHQPRSRRRQKRQPPIPTSARWPETRKSAQPMMSGDQTSRSSSTALRPSMNESTRLIAKTIVPAKRTAALSQASRRGSRDHQRHRAGATPPGSSGSLITWTSEA